MIDRQRFDDKEIQKILKNIVILVDSREKANDHIIQYYDKHNIKYEVTALPVGDYSVALDPCPEFGNERRMYFHQDIIIEKKNSLEELSGCFTQTRERFNDEWSRCWAKRKFLLVENASYEMLVNGEYDTKYNSKSFLGSFHSFVSKYGIEVMFIKDKNYSPIWILGTLQYYLRYLLK